MQEAKRRTQPEINIADEARWNGGSSFKAFCRRALQAVLDAPQGPDGSALEDLPELSIALVDDARMADLHECFSGVPGPTDVLTFHHGEVVVSVDTARSYAAANGLNEHEEVCRYIVHGLLHLHGYDDLSEEKRATMHDLQERLLAQMEIPA